MKWQMRWWYHLLNYKGIKRTTYLGTRKLIGFIDIMNLKDFCNVLEKEMAAYSSILSW